MCIFLLHMASDHCDSIFSERVSLSRENYLHAEKQVARECCNFSNISNFMSRLTFCLFAILILCASVISIQKLKHINSQKPCYAMNIYIRDGTKKREKRSIFSSQEKKKKKKHHGNGILTILKQICYHFYF